jgi:two-component system CheB/CheR fusion protein
VLIAELQHRTRNLLALVQSIARQTLGNGGTLGAFSTRLAALGRVQNLVGNATDADVDLRDIVHQELQAAGAATEGKVVVTGPPIALGFDLVQTFALALHELATNAVKYGALKDASGHLEISWNVRRGDGVGPLLTLDWRESGVSPVPDASRRGFGRELIERALPFTLRAKSELTFREDGVSCHIEMPLVTPATSLGK